MTRLTRSTARPFAGAVVFGPDVPNGARQATAAELASIRNLARQDQRRHEAALQAARTQWGQQALACAAELLASGTTQLSTDHGHVRGRLTRFWRGDSVLELSARDAAGGRGSSMTRLTGPHRTSVELIAGYIIHQIAQLEPPERRS